MLQMGKRLSVPKRNQIYFGVLVEITYLDDTFEVLFGIDPLGFRITDFQRVSLQIRFTNVCLFRDVAKESYYSSISTIQETTPLEVNRYRWKLHSKQRYS